MTREQYEHLDLAISEVSQLQARLAKAGMPATPTYYKLTAIRETLERRLRRTKKPHRQVASARGATIHRQNHDHDPF